MAVSLTVTEDTTLIKAIVGLPEIWERFSDGVNFEDFQPSIEDDSLWLLVNHAPNEIIGVIFVKMDTSCAVEFHPYLREKKRALGRETVFAFFRFFDDHFPEYVKKIHAIIPTCYKSAINCAKKTGFKVEGISKQSYLKGGEYFDRVFLGVLRGDI